MRLSDFDYELPPALVARHPAEARDGSRLLRLDRKSGAVVHDAFRTFPSLLRAGDCLVLNETRVRRARLHARRATGGRVEILLVRPEASATWEAMARPARRLAPGDALEIEDGRGTVRIVSRFESGRVRVHLVAPDGAPLDPETVGAPPLPPYLGREAEATDDERYQTVYARALGAVAAPTAGLHFTADLLGEIEAKGVAIARLVLHVGPGTFKPVTVDDVSEHRMEAETFEYPESAARAIDAARAAGGRVVAVGTTTTRVLETVGPGAAPTAGATELFIRPPHAFRAVDALLTNFHLPRSTLLMLVSAFAGRDAIHAAYREAVERSYRFYSYGDAMFIS